MSRGRQPVTPSRRALLCTCVTLPAPFLLAACSGSLAGNASSDAGGRVRATAELPARAAPVGSAPQVLQPTPACVDDDVTPAQTEGPYFKPNSPQRTSLVEPGVAGTRLIITGQVLGADCTPVARALLEFWQADASGRYDNAGYRLRGHQFTDDVGQYRLETIAPGLYPGRTRHVHVKVQAPNRAFLTTQLYFPGEARNATDSIFNPKLVLAVQDTSGRQSATFDFVMDVG